MADTKVNVNMIGDGQVATNTIAPNAVNSAKVVDGTLTNADFSPTANISVSKLNSPGSSSVFLRGDGVFASSDTAALDEVAFNIGVLGFKMAVNEGLTVFNLVDGVVDEFNSEGGIDTAENSNANYDSSSDFYTNGSYSLPSTTDIQAFWHNDGTINDNESADGGGASNNEVSPFTYTAPPTASAVDLLVIGGGGGGGHGVTASTAGSGGGGGAGGLVYIENFPVTGGGTYPITVGAGGGKEPNSATSGADTTFTSPTPTPFGTSIVGEGGGFGGHYNSPLGPSHTPGAEGGSSGGHGWAGPSSPLEEFTQVTNHPIPGISPAGDNAIDQSPNLNLQGGYGGDGTFADLEAEYAPGAGGGAGENATVGSDNTYSIAGAGLPYNIADGSTSIVYAGGGGGGAGYPMPEGNYSPEAPGGGGRGRGGTNAAGEPADAYPQSPLLNGTTPPQFGPQIAALSFGGGGGAGGNQPGPSAPSGGGTGGSGVVYVSVSQGGALSSTMTLISDTFTANSTPSKARIVVFAELPDGLSDFAVSATRDNTTFNAITLTDSGYVSGSSGTKIFTGSTPLTGTASPQVQLRWKIVGSSLTGTNKIHGVSLQWA